MITNSHTGAELFSDKAQAKVMNVEHITLELKFSTPFDALCNLQQIRQVFFGMLIS